MYFILGTVGCIVLYIFGRKDEEPKPNNLSPKSDEASSVASKPNVSSTDACQRTLENSHKSYHQKPKDFPASSASVKSNPVVNSPVLSSVVDKSSNISQKPTDLASSIAPNYYSQSKDVSSASSQASDSLPKLAASSNSSRPSIYVSEHPASTPANYGKKVGHNCVQKGAFPTSSCPESSNNLIGKDVSASSSPLPKLPYLLPNPVSPPPKLPYLLPNPASPPPKLPYLLPNPASPPPKLPYLLPNPASPPPKLPYLFPNPASPPPKLPHPLSTKPTISLASSKPASDGEKVDYIWVGKGASSTYLCPENFKSLIEKDIVPRVLKNPLSKSTYKEYFQALLYAEDCYLEDEEPPLMTENVFSNNKPNNSSTKSAEASSVASKPNVSSTDAFLRTSENSHKSYHQKPKDLSASSTSVKSNPVVNSPVLSSVVHKSSNISQKPTDLPSIIAPNYYSQSKDVSSASSQASESLPKLAASSNSSRPSIYVSEHPASTPANPASPPPKLPHPLSTKPTISLASSKPASDGEKVDYIWIESGASPTYLCPEDFKNLNEKDIVPRVLKNPLSMSTYKEYFQALLYAEDSYLEYIPDPTWAQKYAFNVIRPSTWTTSKKWDGFEMKNVTLQLQEAAIHTRKSKSKIMNDVKDVEKTFVAFEMDKITEKRLFLLSRDFVTVRPLTKKKNETFLGIIYRVVRSNLVLVEFGEDFYPQHDPSSAYDVKFSFNRVCLKRAHQAISDASSDLLGNVLFPKFIAGNKLHTAEPYFYHEVGGKESCALRQILTLQGSPPYFVEGPLSRSESNQLSETGVFVVKTVLKICQASSSNRILLCAPTNKTCDMFMRGLKKEIPESDMFRANAAFRELDEVPIDILPSSLYETEKECFSCPSLEELCKFKVILCTFMSIFRLHNHGIMAGYFTHIFLVDASSVTEPETLVPLSNFANDRTAVIVTGTQGHRSTWIRSKIARENGLEISYFERVWNGRLHENCDP